jgi:hypothetical protein
MFNLIHRFLNQRNSKLRLHPQAFFEEEFLTRSEHYWIKDNSQSQFIFQKLWEHLPKSLHQFILEDQVSFVLSTDYSQKKFNTSSHIVVIFPQFLDWFKSGEIFMKAFLAHELAFIIYEIQAKNSDPLLAEVEADKFVCDLGLASELEQLLLKMDESPEKRLRLSYLTWNQFGIC